MSHREIWRVRKVVQVCGFTKSTLYREIAAGRFCRPVRLSERCIGFYSDEVLAWIDNRQRAKLFADQPPPPVAIRRHDSGNLELDRIREARDAS